ncbi:signal peptide peptidase SppA [Niastella caeni]|uniref:Signal peptide peptidase SppA n=1 Tax=Niastella caeni TaxID=2569763 RepID=A0A4V4H0B1_9BACT|nr:signal peptide peptidase SppA [Niastella caeni]THU35916.1 signal peptide peptidase SppA [Niastella caeni]
MKSFFKIFLASLLALVVLSVIFFFVFIGIVSSVTSAEKVKTGARAVLVVDLSRNYPEIGVENPLARFSGKEDGDLPSLYDVLRMIRHAKTDSAVKGIYIKCGSNANGMGASQEIRHALIDFKASGKFIYAYGDVITQGGYSVGNVADRIYCNPKGGVDWRGYVIQLAFLKGLLQKLEIEPQIFYAGKFKSATEPFRETAMTDANRLQLTVMLNDMYGRLLLQTAERRKLDTATLHQYANEYRIQYAADAVKYGLIDGLKYDDEVREEISKKLGGVKLDKINFITVQKYAKAIDFKRDGKEKIAVIFAQGDIIDGKGDRDQIGSVTYRDLVRKARLDDNIKAIVVRISSGGGSALASENIWRELTLARKVKPVVVSFGDVAASGAYYLSCNADSIFAQTNTITGSIGVFTMLPNMQKFFNDKLGITFDGVKTGPQADMLSATKPLTSAQRMYLQNSVDSIYYTFKERVAQGRRKDINYIDSIGQGRVWSGTRALELGLVDRLGGLDDAIACAARMAKISDYRLREYPEPHNVLDMIFGGYEKDATQSAMKKELGEDGMKTYQTIKRVKQMVGVTQARMPFEMTIE